MINPRQIFMLVVKIHHELCLLVDDSISLAGYVSPTINVAAGVKIVNVND